MHFYFLSPEDYTHFFTRRIFPQTAGAIRLHILVFI